MWNRVWYQPICSARTRFVTHGVLLLLAFDCLLLMLPRAALYGSGDFNVAHLGWLDRQLPMPSPSLYATTLIFVSIFALMIALGPSQRPLGAVKVIVFLLYTYGWAMSLLDSYQHHYFVSLVLLCIVFFPQSKDHADDRTAAWSYQLLGAIIAIVYLYGAISKLESGWMSGVTAEEWFDEGWLAEWLGESHTAWTILAWLIIVSEFALAAGYAVVVMLAESATGSRGNGLRISMLVLSFLLHIGIEFVGLRIGWFSYYMLLLASAFFLPARFFHLPKPVASVALSKTAMHSLLWLVLT